jgi:DNA mismatch endonuclease (patch repair protein)
MARVRGRDTKPELIVRKALWRAGIRYRLHVRGLPGRPDIVIAKARLVIFVHGCFWHRHDGCGGNRTPKSNVIFWETKLAANVVRDASNEALLRAAGWRVLVVWECETRSVADVVAIVEKVRGMIIIPPI